MASFNLIIRHLHLKLFSVYVVVVATSLAFTIVDRDQHQSQRASKSVEHRRRTH